MRSHIRRFDAVVCGVIVVALVQSAHADVDVYDNVWLSDDASLPGYTVYADDPFTTNIFEGIPDGGNFIDPFGNATNQITFEGRPDAPNNTNINFDIIVGRSSDGELVINGSQLRDQNLIIGDQATINGKLSRGTGTVRIEGPDSLYNNNPDIIPYLGPGQDPDNPTSPSINPRDPMGDFDLFIGRFGYGTLQLTLGGVAEIQDAVILGDQSGSSGTLMIDGVGSVLQSGGFQVGNTSDDEVHYLVVGRLGSGTMSITNGGQSYNSGPAPTSGGGEVVFGAVIGSNFAAEDTAPPSSTGAAGLVTVDGIASKWTIAGNLQVGGFHDNRIGTGPTAEEDLEGNEVLYASDVGQGTLNVDNGGLVSIVTLPLDANGTNAPNRLDFLVGRYGIVNLNGGRIELLGAYSSTDPQDPTSELDRGRLINDGEVIGDGSISVLQFRNRVLGKVQVNAGQKLLIRATGAYTETDNIPLPDEEEYPLSNYGVVAVLGTETARAEIEFDRNAETLPALTRPFLNLPVTGPTAPNGRTEGLIHGEYSTMRFGSGLWNRGVLAFTKGNNVVSGDVISFGDSMPGADDHGRVLLGPDTNVAFEDDFISLGITQISPGATFQVLKGNSLVLGGLTQMVVPGGPFGFDFTPNQISGNATFGGILELTITNGGLLPPLSSIPLFNVGGTILGNFADVVVFGSPLEFFTAVQGNNLILQAFDPALAVGADFNGDGMIDDADYAIWKQNFGTAGPAGDANGDGIVNAADYTEWRDNCCGPFPGSGAGGVGFGGAVPEPASGALLAFGGLLAMAFRRRHSS